MKYNMYLSPVDFYFFGDDIDFKHSYYIKSMLMPQQTSILGMLRFELLRQDPSFELKDYRSYSADEKKHMSDLIGSKSFTMDEDQPRSYGKLKAVGSLCLVNEKNEKLYKMPMDHCVTVGDHYQPYTFSNETIMTNHGPIHYLEDYDPKQGICDAWMTEDGSLLKENEIFRRSTRVGNKKTIGESENTEAFFKQDFYTLNKGYRFMAEVEVADDAVLNDCIVELGKERSSFYVSFEPCLETELPKALSVEDKLYFESDVYLSRDQWTKLLEQTKFRIIDEIGFRSMVGYKEINKARHYFLKKGSVFYINGQKDALISMMRSNKNLVDIGYNNIR